MNPLNLLKHIALYFLGLLGLLVLGIYGLSARDRAVDYKVSIEGLSLPTFSSQQIDFQPTYDATQTLPFAAGAVIDIDGDGVEELFFGGGIHQADALYQFRDGVFHDITAQADWQKQTPDKTFSAVSLDLDKDGDNDLIITRQSGVWLYTNDKGRFTGQQLDLDLDAQTVPLSVALSDLNRDGLYDMYVSGYIARKHVQGETIFNMEYGGISALYMNKGDNQFENITTAAGLSYQHNTFQAIFIDVDNDQLEDLVVAHDTGQVRTWKNLGDLKFENRPNPTSDYFAYPMGIAVTDYQNDTRPDFFFSNVGSTTPDAIVRGDLRDEQVLHKKWLFFENQGAFEFKDTAAKVKLADYEFSWGALFEDFNLDGRDDLVVSENYVGFPPHKLAPLRLDGRFMLQNQQGEFAEVGSQVGVRNRLFGITPLTADFNQDGYPDLVHVNILGPQQVFLSDGGPQGHVKVILPNTVESVGAKVAVTLDDGQIIRQTFIVGEGLVSDQSHQLIFGLGLNAAVDISVRYLDGSSAQQRGTFRNRTINF